MLDPDPLPIMPTLISGALDQFWELIDNKVRPQWTQFGLAWMAVALGVLALGVVLQALEIQHSFHTLSLWIAASGLTPRSAGAFNRKLAEQLRNPLIVSKLSSLWLLGTLGCHIVLSCGIFSFFFLLDEGMIVPARAHICGCLIGFGFWGGDNHKGKIPFATVFL